MPEPSNDDKIQNPIDPYLTVGRLRALMHQHLVCDWASSELEIYADMLDPAKGDGRNSPKRTHYIITKLRAVAEQLAREARRVIEGDPSHA